MSLFGDIVATYRAPRRVMERRFARGSEATVLLTLMAACGLIFVAQWPLLARLSHIDPSVTLEQRIGAALMGWVFFAPLLFYALGGLVWLGIRLTGRAAPGLAVRTGVFWSLLAATPLWLVYGLAQGAIGPGLPTTVIGLFLLVALFYFFISGITFAFSLRPPA